ncbi:MAG: hypothetical protein CMF39_04160, partial [Legionellaceae bacterium]|nr:hypothetical protein [Legionellaceae bacterium]
KVKSFIYCLALLLAASSLATAKGASSDEHATALAPSISAPPISQSLSDIDQADAEAASIVLPTQAQLNAALVHLDTHPITATSTDPQGEFTQADVNNMLKQAEYNEIMAGATAAQKRFDEENPGYVLKGVYYGGQAAIFVASNAAMGKLTSGAKSLYRAATSARNAANEAATNDAQATNELNSEISNDEAINENANDPNILAEGEAADGLYGGAEAEGTAGEVAADVGDIGDE